MNEDSNPNLRRTSKEILLQDSVNSASNSESIEHGGTPSGSTEDNNLKHATIICSGFNNLDKDPMFVIVDSGGMSNPSSNEILINKSVGGEVKCKRCFKNRVIPDDIPTTSRDNVEFMTNHFGESESGELQMVDINLESENEIAVDDSDNDFESIVIAYLRDKNCTTAKDDKLLTTRRKSTILENVPKMETIIEGEQFLSFAGPSNKESIHVVDSNDRNKYK